MVFVFFNLGFGELFAVFVVVLLLFGADKIPQFARSLGKGIRYVKDATDSVKRDIQDSVDDVKSDLTDHVKDVKKNVDMANSVKRDASGRMKAVFDDLAASVEEKPVKPSDATPPTKSKDS